jgi:NDP-sugar pyrophosphorylase family protein
MQINHCLILAAGHGTRMGKIGQAVPKVLWPVYEKSLLELQVAYAKSLGAEKIYINLHHMSEEILEFCKNKSVFEDVIFLHEKPSILDIGGAVHNLAAQPNVNYKGKLLVLNADQFFYLKPEVMEKYLGLHPDAPSVLFSYFVEADLGYNALELNNRREVIGIIKNADLKKGARVETYTGISYINLEKLSVIKGASSFFDSVCPFKEKKIPAISLENVDYWDFGTVKRYWETMFRLLKIYSINSNHPFIRFLVNEKALKTWKINFLKSSYHSTTSQVINLAPDANTNELGPAIILVTTSVGKKNGNNIFWKNISEEVI